MKNPVFIAVALSGIASSWDQYHNQDYLLKLADDVLRGGYAPDRVLGIAALTTLLPQETHLLLWNRLLETSSREDEVVSFTSLGTQFSPKLDLFEAIANKGPAWLLPKCLEVGSARADLWLSRGVIEAVMKRWSELIALQEFDEVDGVSMVLDHSARQGRKALLNVLVILAPVLARILGPQGLGDLTLLLKQLNRIIP